MSEMVASDDLARIEARVARWLFDELERNPLVLAVDTDEPFQRRWYLRLRGEEKDFTTIWITLGQRTLAYETYVMPAPEENHAAFYEHLLRRNARLVGAQFAIGAEDAVYLMGNLPLSAFSESELDRIVGTLLASVEQFFRPALHLGFASRFR
jgi:hypothetical protein